MAGQVIIYYNIYAHTVYIGDKWAKGERKWLRMLRI